MLTFSLVFVDFNIDREQYFLRLQFAQMFRHLSIPIKVSEATRNFDFIAP